MKLYLVNTRSHCCSLVRVAAELTSQKVEVVVVDEALKKQLAPKNPTGLYPLLETSEGFLTESTAIATYFAQLAGGNFLGTNALERTLVDQWISYSNSTLASLVSTVNKGIFGTSKVAQKDWNDAAKNLKASVKTLNSALEGKKFLVGNDISIADIVVLHTIMPALQTILDAGFRKAMKNVDAWAQGCFALPAVVKVLGNVKMCAKPLKPIVEVEKKEVKKAQAPAPAAPKKKEEKKKDNVESLPPTNFDLFNFKTFFVNHGDKKGEAVD